MSEPERVKYSDPNWKSHVETEKYDSRRFDKTSVGQKQNQREREMVRKFLERLPSNQFVLDAPSGIGRFTDVMARLGHRPLSADLNWGRALDSRHRLATPVPALQADIMHLPLMDDSVDAAICIRLLHHLPPEQIVCALRELRRVAKRALATFYATSSLKYWKKSLRGKSLSGQYYPPGRIAKLSAAAGWKNCQHNEPLDFFHQLHSVELSR